MMCRRGGKGGSWALFLPRGFEGLVLFPPASLCLSPHFLPTLCSLDGWSHCLLLSYFPFTAEFQLKPPALFE